MLDDGIPDGGMMFSTFPAFSGVVEGSCVGSPVVRGIESDSAAGLIGTSNGAGGTSGDAIGLDAEPAEGVSIEGVELSNGPWTAARGCPCDSTGGTTGSGEIAGDVRIGSVGGESEFAEAEFSDATRSDGASIRGAACVCTAGGEDKGTGAGTSDLVAGAGAVGVKGIVFGGGFGGTGFGVTGAGVTGVGTTGEGGAGIGAIGLGDGVVGVIGIEVGGTELGGVEPDGTGAGGIDVGGTELGGAGETGPLGGSTGGINGGLPVSPGPVAGGAGFGFSPFPSGELDCICAANSGSATPSSSAASVP